MGRFWLGLLKKEAMNQNKKVIKSCTKNSYIGDRLLEAVSVTRSFISVGMTQLD